MDMMMNSQVAGAAPIRSYYSNLDYYTAIDDFTFQVKFTKKPKPKTEVFAGFIQCLSIFMHIMKMVSDMMILL